MVKGQRGVGRQKLYAEKLHTEGYEGLMDLEILVIDKMVVEIILKQLDLRRIAVGTII